MSVGDWLHANGTTLGADNGLGVAAILAVLENETAPLPPIEALFTVDEETGLTGAQQLDGSILSGKTLLNLDTEDFGALYVVSTETLVTCFYSHGVLSLAARLF